jgi:hypothetical protein
MTLLHGRWRARARLIACDALSGREREETLRHLEDCAGCRDERDASLAALAAVTTDRASLPELPIPLSALVTRVNARLDEEERQAAPARRWPALVAVAAAAALAVVFVRPVAAPSVAPGPARSAAPVEVVSEETLQRLESRLAREHAARYLSDAHEVLVNVAASPQRCARGGARVDVGAEAERSRELLASRALLVESDRAEVAGARSVLDDVEATLREVAALESCARVRDLDAISRRMEAGRLLMKIDLMTRELQG